MIETLIEQLLRYSLQKRLIEPEDTIWARNSLMSVLGLEALEPMPTGDEQVDGVAVMEAILDWAYETGRLSSRYADCSDLLDTKLMGCLTPRPSAVTEAFGRLAAGSPQDATDWFYRFSQDCRYIRTDRVARNQTWKTGTVYGELDITINCSKPEKDPKAIAEAGKAASAAYPACLLCLENVGYAGRADHPARQNLRVIPVTLNGEPWYFQYSPYVYYNEHAIIFSEKHIPMAITRETFIRLLDFIDAFPHYFIGSNADLPIVGGSMLSHDHYQGGRYTFAMERAAALSQHGLSRYPAVICSHLNWPLTVLRLRSNDRDQLLEAADAVRQVWQHYSDPEAGIAAASEGIPHNTLTPIARKRGTEYELDLVLRNNRQTVEFPDGIFHPHPEIHPVKKENIGLIEVMGLAVLPDRLIPEMAALATWLEAQPASAQLPEPLEKFTYLLGVLNTLNLPAGTSAEDALQHAVGIVFAKGLEHCGVYGTDEAGQLGVKRFIEAMESGGGL